jgi:hypothetical protein
MGRHLNRDHFNTFPALGKFWLFSQDFTNTPVKRIFKKMSSPECPASPGIDSCLPELNGRVFEDRSPEAPDQQAAHYPAGAAQSPASPRNAGAARRNSRFWFLPDLRRFSISFPGVTVSPKTKSLPDVNARPKVVSARTIVPPITGNRIALRAGSPHGRQEIYAALID